MLLVFIWGSWLVWNGITTAVLNFHQFAGATALLCLGGVFTAMRGIELFRASVEKTNDGEFARPRLVRYRQRAVALVALANVVANAFCVVVVLVHHISGRVPLTSFDRWMLLCGALGLAVLVIAKRGGVISKPEFMFSWAVGWRTIPILVTAIVPVLLALGLYATNDPQMPLYSAIGMAVIASQAWLLLFIERIDCNIALKQHPDHPTHLSRRTRAGWGLVGEGLNLLASGVLVVGIWGGTMMA
jgi:hypothetical protein